MNLYWIICLGVVVPILAYLWAGLILGNPRELAAGPLFGNDMAPRWWDGASDWSTLFGHTFFWPVTILKCNRPDRQLSAKVFHTTFRAHRCPWNGGGWK